MSAPTEGFQIQQTEPMYTLEIFTNQERVTWAMRLKPDGEIEFNLDELTMDEAAQQVVEKIQQFSRP